MGRGGGAQSDRLGIEFGGVMRSKRYVKSAYQSLRCMCKDHYDLWTGIMGSNSKRGTDALKL